MHDSYALARPALPLDIDSSSELRAKRAQSTFILPFSKSLCFRALSLTSPHFPHQPRPPPSQTSPRAFHQFQTCLPCETHHLLLIISRSQSSTSPDVVCIPLRRSGTHHALCSPCANTASSACRCFSYGSRRRCRPPRQGGPLPAALWCVCVHVQLFGSVPKSPQTVP